MAAAAQPERAPEWRGDRKDIEYAIVALDISAIEVAGIIRAATGVSVDFHSNDMLNALNRYQLESVWERLSADHRWKKRDQ